MCLSGISERVLQLGYRFGIYTPVQQLLPLLLHSLRSTSTVCTGLIHISPLFFLITQYEFPLF